MRPTRRTQPYRGGRRRRRHGEAFRAMVRGRTAGGYNPMDAHRRLQKQGRRRRRK